MRPPRCTRTSELLFPPNTGRSFTSATLHPSRAADTAALMPATPPPTTTRSNPPWQGAVSGSCKALRLNPANASASEGGSRCASVVKKIASQRPSKPVRSCSRTSACNCFTATLPAGCHIHRSPSTPNWADSLFPPTLMLKRPGPSPFIQGDVQL